MWLILMASNYKTIVISGVVNEYSREGASLTGFTAESREARPALARVAVDEVHACAPVGAWL
jgi:hypothetical protein